MALLPILCFGPMIMAIVSYITGRFSKAARDVVVALTGIATFAGCLLLWNMEGSFTIVDFCGFPLSLKVDGFRSLYALVASFMWMMTGLFSKQYFAHYHNRNRYFFFNLMTLGATLGVFLSDDLYTTFIFFEVMSLTSYVWVAHDETPAAMKAAGTYLTVAVIGGLTTLMGLFMIWSELGTLSFDGIQAALKTYEPGVNALTVPTWLVLFGFAAKAGLFPLHIWLPKAHPVAPAPASALLSGILTKSGVFGLIVICSRIMAGNEAFGNALLVLAVITMFLGALLALFSIDLKRTLACSSMSQIGFITVGLCMMVLLGEHGALSAYGTVMHMMNHSLIKLCLFMCAGVVYMNLHKLDLNEIRGFGRGKPVLHISFLLGALSIGCIPGIGSGYISKSLLHEAILELVHHLHDHGHNPFVYQVVEILFLISGGLTIAYMTKLYICIFWEKNPVHQEKHDSYNRKYINPVSAVVLLVSAIILPFFSIFPVELMEPVGVRSAHFFGQHALDHEIPYYGAANLIGAAQSMGIGAAIYLLIVRPLLMKKVDGVRVYVNLWPAKLDLEELVYRPLLTKILPGIAGSVCGFIAHIPDSKLVLKVIPGIAVFFTRLFADIPEWIACLFNGTLLRKLRKHKKVPVGNRFTYTIGCCMNFVSRLLNRTVLHHKPARTDFEFVLDASWREFTTSFKGVTRSMSFGLLLMCVGLFITVLYLTMH